MDMTDYMKDVVGDHLLRDQAFSPPSIFYLALFTSATDDTGGGTEATGGGYARQEVTLTPFVNGVSTNVDELMFTSLAADDYTHAALMDALTGGNMWMHDELPDPETVANGGGILVEAGSLTVTFQ